MYNLEHLLTEFVSLEELDGTMVTTGTILTNPMKAQDLTKMALVFWLVIGTSILPQVGHHSEVLLLCRLHSMEDPLREEDQLLIPHPQPHLEV